MVNIIKEELPIEESLRKKLELICEFAKTTPKIINGNIRKIDRTNLTYIEPNRIIIKDKTFLIDVYKRQAYERIVNIATITTAIPERSIIILFFLSIFSSYYI